MTYTTEYLVVILVILMIVDLLDRLYSSPNSPFVYNEDDIEDEE